MMGPAPHSVKRTDPGFDRLGGPVAPASERWHGREYYEGHWGLSNVRSWVPSGHASSRVRHPEPWPRLPEQARQEVGSGHHEEDDGKRQEDRPTLERLVRLHLFRLPRQPQAPTCDRSLVIGRPVCRFLPSRRAVVHGCVKWVPGADIAVSVAHGCVKWVPGADIVAVEALHRTARADPIRRAG